MNEFKPGWNANGVRRLVAFARADQCDRPFLAVPVLQQFERADDDATWVRIANQDADRQSGPLGGLRRRFDGLDQHFILVPISFAKRNDVDLHAVLLGQIGLLFRVAEVLVAVREQDDALAGVLRGTRPSPA